MKNTMRDVSENDVRKYVESCGGKICHDETIKICRDDSRWKKLFIESSQGVRIGRVMFRNGRVFSTKSYKKDYHREIDETDFIFMGLDRMVFGNGKGLSKSEFAKLVQETVNEVGRDLAERLAWRESNPRLVDSNTGKPKTRSRLQGKNPRMVLWNKIIGRKVDPYEGLEQYDGDE